MTDDIRPKSSRSLVTLIRDLPGLLIGLLKAELNRAMAELKVKLVSAGIGIGLLVGAAVFVFFAVGVLVAAAVLGLAVVFPGWLSALIVAAALLVIAAVLVLIGINRLKKGMPPVPTETIASVKEDVGAIKGMGDYGN